MVVVATIGLFADRPGARRHRPRRCSPLSACSTCTTSGGSTGPADEAQDRIGEVTELRPRELRRRPRGEGAGRRGARVGPPGAEGRRRCATPRSRWPSCGPPSSPCSTPCRRWPTSSWWWPARTGSQAGAMTVGDVTASSTCSRCSCGRCASSASCSASCPGRWPAGSGSRASSPRPIEPEPKDFIGRPSTGLGIALDDVHFAYEPGREVLTGVDLSVATGPHGGRGRPDRRGQDHAAAR